MTATLGAMTAPLGEVDEPGPRDERGVLGPRAGRASGSQGVFGRPGPRAAAGAETGAQEDGEDAQDTAGARPRIAVVDYGMGNRRSVEKALQRVGAQAFVTRDHAALRAADGLLLPGVGAFPAAMATIGELGLDEVLRECAAAGTPLFGSCMGMQLLFEHSSEHGGAAGLGLLRGEVRELRAPGLKLPHIGWSEVRWRGPSVLSDGLADPCFLYHVHSFVAQPADPEVVLASAEYGERFPAVVGAGNVFGAQSHPEKSSAHGLRLLGNFVAICARTHTRTCAHANGGSKETDMHAPQHEHDDGRTDDARTGGYAHPEGSAGWARREEGAPAGDLGRLGGYAGGLDDVLRGDVGRLEGNAGGLECEDVPAVDVGRLEGHTGRLVEDVPVGEHRSAEGPMGRSAQRDARLGGQERLAS